MLLWWEFGTDVVTCKGCNGNWAKDEYSFKTGLEESQQVMECNDCQEKEKQLKIDVKMSRRRNKL